MTTINISVRIPAQDGSLVPAKGQLRWTPTRRRDVDGTVVLPHPFTVNLVDGDATVDVEPSTAERAWMVDEYFLGIPSRTIHVAVPATGPVAYTGLTVLDPATLLPTAEPEAAWWAVADSTVTTGAVVGDDLILTRTDGTDVNAGNVRGLPGVDGADGAPGAEGDSAYEIAVANGFVGTETEWLASLEGTDGSDAEITPENVGPVALGTLIRPNRWARVYRVNPAGDGGAFTTISGAITQAITDRNASTGGNFDWNPYFRALILVDPGAYNENLAPGGYIDIVGSTGNRDDVVVSWDGNNPVIECSGKSAYIANLTAQFGGISTTGGTYALHSDASGNSTLICDNVWFESTNPNRRSAVGIGTDGGQVQFFNNCVFKSPGSDAINYHNIAARKAASFAIFTGCEILGTPSRGLLVSDLGSGQQDIVMWIDGSITASVAKVHLEQTSATKTLKVTVDPAVATAAEITATTTGFVLRSKAFPVAPVAGMSRYETDYYYPARLTPAGDVLGADIAPDATVGSPAAQRVYYYPIPVPYGCQVKNFRLPVITAAGTVAAGLYADDGTGKPGGTFLQRSGATTATAGVMTLTGVIAKRTIFPGYNRVWLAVVASSATASLLMSNHLSHLTPCFYQDVTDGLTPVTATPLALTAGSAVPLVGIITI